MNSAFKGRPGTATPVPSVPPTHAKHAVVVIPTTHRVPQVIELASDVLASCPIAADIIVVDNSPNASLAPWVLPPRHHVIVVPKFLGSGEAFRVGAIAALRLAPDWVLLLDHDARLSSDSVAELFRVANTDESCAYSCNQNGTGSGWSVFAGGAFGQVEWEANCLELVPVHLAQWSGLLLSRRATHLLAEFESSYFFGWDDWLFTHRLNEAHCQVFGVPQAVIGNVRDSQTSSWRSYYQSRNHLLFLRDCGVKRPGVYARAMTQRLRVGVGQVRQRQLSSGLATIRGTAAGCAGRRRAHSRYMPGVLGWPDTVRRNATSFGWFWRRGA